MTTNHSQNRNRAFFLTGLGVALLIAVFVSPFASSNPDGLDRVAKDLGFVEREAANKPAHQLPFYTLFNEYALRGVPEAIATPLAGLTGTLLVFGLAWGVGKLAVRKSASQTNETELGE